MKKPTKRYILWTYSDGGYSPTEYDELEEALTVEKYTHDYYITEAINRISASSFFDKPKDEPLPNQ